MNFCSNCGSNVTLRTPEGDHLPRFVCDTCGTIHYQNPKVVTGCILDWKGRVLLCRRAIEPRYGRWTLPAGFMENHETTVQAALRETREEANAEVEEARLFAVFNLPHISQVYIMFRGRLRHGRASPGAESLEVKLFNKLDIPWKDLAFPVVHESLELYFEDCSKGKFTTHVGDIIRGPNYKLQINRY